VQADIHTLFDRDLLASDPQTREVRLAPPLLMTQYQTFYGHRLPDPKEEWQRPSQDLLNERWEEFQNAWKTTLALSCSRPLAVVAAVVNDM
jgi:putative restriction endonuclease